MIEKRWMIAGLKKQDNLLWETAVLLENHAGTDVRGRRFIQEQLRSVTRNLKKLRQKQKEYCHSLHPSSELCSR